MVEFSLEQFETIGSFYGDILERKANIKTVDDFLRETSHGKDFKPLLEKLKAPDKKRTRDGKDGEEPEVTEERLAEWSQVFDLFRIPRVSPRMAELLVHAGINSVRELSHRDPIQVWYKIKELDESSYFIVIKSPSLAEIESWVYYAKLMTRRIKYGYDVPLVELPMMSVNWASELQKYRIWTVEDLEANYAIIPNLASRIGMKASVYEEMIGVCDLCKVDGIDIHVARLLAQAGIKSLQQLRGISPDEAFNRLAKVKTGPLLKEHPEIEMELSRDGIAMIQQNSKELKVRSFMEAME
ncbi:MAG: DUF4332 domain-containing protein [Candidatus Lokiarchaeota archaeon]|nr:DUF4332 domain-containing protein [Candidatus Lokiarchaeota archaeon]